MARPDFRAAATVRLKAERSKGLSANVLRLIHGGDSAGPSVSPADPLHSGGEPGLEAGERETPREPGGGLCSARAWKAAMRSEERRFSRYHTPVTLIVAELQGLAALPAGPSREAVDRLAAAVGLAIRRRVRATDVVVRDGRARLLAMLPETDEIAAINCVERVRSQCDGWLEETGLALGLAVGWAQPGEGMTLSETLSVAEGRMAADRRRLRDAN